MGLDITGLSGVFDFANGVLERIFPDPKDRLEATFKLKELEANGELAKLAAETDLAKGQLDINKIEAGSENLFVSGWRPFIGWTCGGAFAYHFIVQPFLAFGLAIFEINVNLPSFDMSTLLTVLMGILGLGTMRSAEKMTEIRNR